MRRPTPFSNALPDDANIRWIEFGNNAFDPLPEAGLKALVLLAMRRPLANVIRDLTEEGIGEKISSRLPPQLLAGTLAIGLGMDGNARREVMISGDERDMVRLEPQARRLQGEIDDASLERKELMLASSERSLGFPLGVLLGTSLNERRSLLLGARIN
jgi:hypothetical protein